MNAIKKYKQIVKIILPKFKIHWNENTLKGNNWKKQLFNIWQTNNWLKVDWSIDWLKKEQWKCVIMDKIVM